MRIGWRSRGLEPRVDRVGLQGEDGEDRFVDAPQRFAAGQPLERLQAERVLAQRERALEAQVAVLEPDEVLAGTV